MSRESGKERDGGARVGSHMLSNKPTTMVG